MASVVINAQPGQVLQLGRLHSSGQVIVNFNLNSWRDAFNDHSNGRVALYYSALDDNTPSMTVVKTMTVAEVQANNNIFPWDVEYLITDTPGPGYCQIILQSTDGNTNYESYMYQTVVTKSVYYFNTDEESAAVYNKWLDRISSIYTAVDDITASAEFVNDETAGGVEVSKNDYGSVNLHFKLPAAPQFTIAYDYPNLESFEVAFGSHLFELYDFIIINGSIESSDNSKLFMSNVDMTVGNWQYVTAITTLPANPIQNGIYKALNEINIGGGITCGTGDYITYDETNSKWIYAVNYLSDLSGTQGVGVSAVTVHQDGRMYVTYTNGITELVEGEAYYSAMSAIRTAAESARAGAVAAMNDAVAAKNTATSAAATATSKANEASSSKDDAETAATAAATSENNSNNSSLRSEGFAVGSQNGTPVESGSVYYQNNSAYYSGQASQSSSDAQESALKSEGYALGTQNGTPAVSGQVYYNNNAKFYAESAQASSTSAQTSASSAQANATDISNIKSEVTELKNQAETASNIAVNSAADASTYADNASTSAGNASDSATSSNNYSLASEGYALGEQNGYAVTAGSPYYQNSSKYYASQSNLSSQDSQTSANNSRTSSLIAEGYSVGTQDGQQQQSGTYFENNAKYYAEEAQNSAETANTDVLLSKYWAQGNRTNAEQGIGEENVDGGEYYTKNSQYYAIQSRYWAEGKLDNSGNEIEDTGASFNSQQQYFNNARFYKEYIRKTEAGIDSRDFNALPLVTPSEVLEYNTTTGAVSGKHLKLNFSIPRGYPGSIFVPYVDANSNISWTEKIVRVDEATRDIYWQTVDSNEPGITVPETQNIAGLPAQIYINPETGLGATATIDNKVGTPTVAVETTIPDPSNPRFFTLKFNFGSLKGERGETGRGLTILGTVSSVSELPADPQPGDAYGVENGSGGYDVYIYDGLNQDWILWDSSGGGGQSIRELYKGYLYQGDFYTTTEYSESTRIPRSSSYLYIELNEDCAYHWDGDSYDRLEAPNTLHFTSVPGNPITQNQFLYYNGSGWTNTNLPIATTSTKGIIQVGTGLLVADGTVSVDTTAILGNFTTIDTTNHTLQFSM